MDEKFHTAEVVGSKNTRPRWQPRVVRLPDTEEMPVTTPAPLPSRNLQRAVRQQQERTREAQNRRQDPRYVGLAGILPTGYTSSIVRLPAGRR